MIYVNGSARRQRRPGVAAVEFAIVGSVMVVLIMGMAEVARGMMVKETLSNAARRSCRTGILPTGSNAAITTDVNNVMAEHNISAADVTVKVMVNDKEVDASTALQNDKISVQVSIQASKVAWVTPVFLSGTSYASETVIMMRQR